MPGKDPVGFVRYPHGLRQVCPDRCVGGQAVHGGRDDISAAVTEKTAHFLAEEGGCQQRLHIGVAAQRSGENTHDVSLIVERRIKVQQNFLGFFRGKIDPDPGLSLAALLVVFPAARVKGSAAVVHGIPAVRQNVFDEIERRALQQRVKDGVDILDDLTVHALGGGLRGEPDAAGGIADGGFDLVCDRPHILPNGIVCLLFQVFPGGTRVSIHRCDDHDCRHDQQRYFDAVSQAVFGCAQIPSSPSLKKISGGGSGCCGLQVSARFFRLLSTGSRSPCVPAWPGTAQRRPG